MLGKWLNFHNLKSVLIYMTLKQRGHLFLKYLILGWKENKLKILNSLYLVNLI